MLNIAFGRSSSSILVILGMESQFTKMSEALYYKLPNLCKVLKVNQARLGALGFKGKF